MKYGLYCIKDTLVGFMTPFIQPNDATAIREFSNIVNNSNTSVSVNFANMELYRIGSFDSNNGDIESKVEYLIKGADVKDVKE